MKPPPFDLAAPATLAEATALLARGDARVIAGGQSLLQDLRWRRVRPALLVDVAGIDELAGITGDGATVRIGARVRHRDVERPRSTVPGPLGALLAETAGWIAHPPVRARGTLVGSLAWGHPAAEWCALAAGLDGRVELASTTGRREERVADLLLGPGRTSCAPSEMISALLLPRLPEGTRTAVAESRRTHASFAHVAVTAALLPDGRPRLGLAGAGPTARRAHAAEAAFTATGNPAAAGDAAAADDADPREHPHATPDYTRHVVGVLVRRALTAVSGASEEDAA